MGLARVFIAREEGDGSDGKEQLVSKYSLAVKPSVCATN